MRPLEPVGVKIKPTPSTSLPADCITPGITHFKKASRPLGALGTADVARPSGDPCDLLCMRARIVEAHDPDRS